MDNVSYSIKKHRIKKCCSILQTSSFIVLLQCLNAILLQKVDVFNYITESIYQLWTINGGKQVIKVEFKLDDMKSLSTAGRGKTDTYCDIWTKCVHMEMDVPLIS